MKYFVFAFLALFVLFTAVFVRTDAGLQKKRISFTMYKYEKYDVFRRAAGKEFEQKWNWEHPDDLISVRYEPISGSAYAIKLNAEAVADTMQDVFIIEDFHEFARQGLLLDVTPYVERLGAQEYLDRIYPALLDFHRIDGRLYGLPHNLNTEVLYYNRALFEREGLDYPDESWTWDDMLAAAKRLTKRDARGRLIQVGLVQGNPRFWVLWNGGRFWNDEGDRCTVNSPETLAALQFYHDLQFKHRVSPRPSDLQDTSGDRMFQNNRAAMLVGARWWTSMFQDLADVKWAVAPLPKSFAGRRPAYMCFIPLGIYAKTKHPEVAFQFLMRLSEPEQVRKLIDVGDSIPIRHGEQANAEFLSDPTRPEGENRAYLMGMDDPIVHWGPEEYSAHLSVGEQEDRTRTLINGLADEKADVGALLAELETDMNRLYALRTAPPRKESAAPVVILLLVVASALVGGRYALRRLSLSRERRDG